ncbi:MAG: Hsp20/alpha crystallin family protein [Planctomycetota bacterium]
MQKSNQATLPQLRDPFQTLFSRLFGDTLTEFYNTNEAVPAPRTDISETDAGYELSFELPGVDEKDITVNMQEHMLTVTAERKDQREASGKRWHRVEQRYGQFTRTIALPHDAANSGIEAVYQKGVLLVKVPKAPESRPTKIQVRAN